MTPSPEIGPMTPFPEISKTEWVIFITSEVVGKRRRRIPPSANSSLHFHELAKWKKVFKEQAWWRCKEQSIRRMERAKVVIENHTLQPMDRDNLYSAMKSIIDGVAMAALPEKMTKSGPMYLDDDKHLDLICKNVQVDKRVRQKIKITITEWV